MLGCRRALRSFSTATEFFVRKAKERAVSQFALEGLPSPTLNQPHDLPTTVHPDVDKENLLLDSVPALDLSAFPHAEASDPFALIADDMGCLVDNIKVLLGVDHPVLSTVAKYFFDNDGGKKVRPAMVLLMAYASNASAAVPEPLPSQTRLAEITELIHTASLLHDDVIDMADTRRGVGSVNAMFGNKLAVLAGDFLLARSSLFLARLRNVEVVELLSTVIEHLVRGEVMQMKHALARDDFVDVFDVYLKKSYYKTGSLMANGCMAVSLLGGHEDAVSLAAFQYGKHVGIAFQLIDDLLDFEGTANAMGKPVLNDLKQGLATAPVLFASKRHPELLKLIQRKFEGVGDVERTCACVHRSQGLQATRKLAYAHGQAALDSLGAFPDSPHRTALASLVARVVNRIR